MKPNKKQIEEIVDYLENGMRCFFNRKTGEIDFYMDGDTRGSTDRSLGKDAIEGSETKEDDFVEFYGFDSHEAFDIMADFAESVADETLQRQLFTALNRNHPFRNFKTIIDRSGKYREQWFKFRRMRFIQSVTEQTDDSIELNDE